MRNIEHIEFWRTDADRRRLGLREAPDYSLSRAKSAIQAGQYEDIENIIAEAENDA